MTAKVGHETASCPEPDVRRLYRSDSVARPVQTLRVSAALVALCKRGIRMNQNDHFTRAERISRIGEILAKGVTLMVIREAETKQKTASIPAATAAVQEAERVFGGDELETDVLKYISRVGSASPKDIQRALNIPKTTAFRRLDRLVKAGCIVRTGKTAAIRYSMPVPPPRSERTLIV